MIDGLVIRPSTRADYEALCRLYRDMDRYHAALLPADFRVAWDTPREAEHFEPAWSTADAELLVAAAPDGELVGIAYVRIESPTASPVRIVRPYGMVDELAVREGYRRRGIASRLMAAVHSWLRERQIESVQLHVYEVNGRAQRFYEELGYATRSRILERRLQR